jgi:D-alanine-D-alanine ligase
MTISIKKNILVLFGGKSSEHAVSCVSASSILKNIDRGKYEVYTIGINKNGRWYLTEASADDIRSGAWEKDGSNRIAYIVPDSSVKAVVTEDGERIPVDCVMPVLHGKNGEDGVMQGLLDLSGIPYVGSGVLASAAAMDKTVTKMLVEKTSVKQADYYICQRFDFAHSPEEQFKKIKDHFSDTYPLFVKPANAGSSVGITKAHDEKELFEGIKTAFAEDHKILIEKAVVGRELEVAVLGNREPVASPVGEIKAAGEFYDYRSKYEDAASIAELAEDIDEDKVSELQEAAVTIYKLLDCRGLSRVDFFLAGEDVVFNEINTIPGFTEISMYPKLFKAAGIEYSELIDKLISLALEEE